MHTVQWNGAAVIWAPRDDTYAIEVGAAFEPPELAAWLQAHLADHLRKSFAGHYHLAASVSEPRDQQGRAPMCVVTISGLREPLPEPQALQDAVATAIEQAEDAVAAKLRRAAEYTDAHRSVGARALSA